MSRAIELEVVYLLPSPTNPRKTFDQAGIKELAKSIKQSGLISPLTVRAIPDLEKLKDFAGNGISLQDIEDLENTLEDLRPTYYEVVSGERRLRALREIAKKLKTDEVLTAMCMVRELDDDEVLGVQITENLQREDLSPLEEADAFKMASDRKGMSVKDVAKMVGKSPAFIYQRMQLLHLSADWREKLAEEKIFLSLALEIARLPEAAQADVFDHATYSDKQFRQTQSDIRGYIKNMYIDLSKVHFPTDDPDLVKDVPACTKCPKNTSTHNLLFPDLKGALCMDAKCLAGKVKAWQKLMRKAYEDSMADEQLEPAYLSTQNWIYNESEARKDSGLPKGKELLTTDRYEIIEDEEADFDTKGIIVHAGQYDDKNQERIGDIVRIKLITEKEEQPTRKIRKLTKAEVLANRAQAQIAMVMAIIQTSDELKDQSTMSAPLLKMVLAQTLTWTTRHNLLLAYRDLLKKDLVMPEGMQEDLWEEYEKLNEEDEEHGYDDFRDYVAEKVPEFYDKMDPDNWYNTGLHHEDSEHAMVYILDTLSKRELIYWLLSAKLEFDGAPSVPYMQDVYRDWIEQAFPGFLAKVDMTKIEAENPLPGEDEEE